MALALYMDHHVPKAVTIGLRTRGVDVLTAFEDGTREWSDADLLDRATSLQRVLFTQDEDFLAEVAIRLRSDTPFFGVVYGHQLRVSIGECVNDLEIIAKAGEPVDANNRVQFLPL